MEQKNLKVYSGVLNIQMNALMWDHLISFDLIGIIEKISDVDWGKAQSELPKSLRSILESPMEKDSDGNYLVGTDMNKINLTYDFPGSKKAEHLIKRGLYFSLLLYRKLAQMEKDKFRVHFVFGIARYIDCVVFFNPVREEDGL